MQFRGASTTGSHVCSGMPNCAARRSRHVRVRGIGQGSNAPDFRRGRHVRIASDRSHGVYAFRRPTRRWQTCAPFKLFRQVRRLQLGSVRLIVVARPANNNDVHLMRVENAPGTAVKTPGIVKRSTAFGAWPIDVEPICFDRGRGPSRSDLRNGQGHQQRANGHKADSARAHELEHACPVVFAEFFGSCSRRQPPPMPKHTMFKHTERSPITG
jgi:hypothetical protein